MAICRAIYKPNYSSLPILIPIASVVSIKRLSQELGSIKWSHITHNTTIKNALPQLISMHIETILESAEESFFFSIS